MESAWPRWKGGRGQKGLLPHVVTDEKRSGVEVSGSVPDDVHALLNAIPVGAVAHDAYPQRVPAVDDGARQVHAFRRVDGLQESTIEVLDIARLRPVSERDHG